MSERPNRQMQPTGGGGSGSWRAPGSPRPVSTGRAIVFLAGLAGVVPGAAAQTLSAHELHDRIVAVFSARATRPLPIGDTLISWYGHPILFHTVARSGNGVREGMLRSDSLLGTAEVEWHAGRVSHATARWTHGDSVEADVELTVQGDSISVTGTTSSARATPPGPWGVADYGMEDLLVPTLRLLPGRTEAAKITVYRPYAGKWEDLQVSQRVVGDGVLYELRDADGKRDRWLVSHGGDLVQLRREGQDFERRPLEETRLTPEYNRLKQLLPS